MEGQAVDSVLCLVKNELSGKSWEQLITLLVRLRVKSQGGRFNLFIQPLYSTYYNTFAIFLPWKIMKIDEFCIRVLHLPIHTFFYISLAQDPTL